MYEDRIRRPALMNKVMSAEQAALLFKDGMTVGMSGFTRAGDAKALPLALVERTRQSPLHLTLLTGASLGNDSDGLMANAGVVARRMPFQDDAALRRNEGKLSADGPLVVETGAHTGRSAQDKFIVRDAETENSVWWCKSNKAMEPQHFAALKADFMKALRDKGLPLPARPAGAPPEPSTLARPVPLARRW